MPAPSTPSSTRRVVVLGGGYAGLSVALRLRSRAPSDTAITLIDARAHFVERVRLHQALVGTASTAFDYRSWLGDAGIAFVRGRVEALRPQTREVLVDGRRLGYDHLVFALGSTVDRRTPGAAEHAVPIEAGPALREAAQRMAGAHPERPPTVVVVGGGLTGIEVASEVAAAFERARVLLVCGRLAPGLGRTARARLELGLARRGVEVRAGVHVRAVESGRLRLADGSEVAFDHCLWAPGFTAPTLARDAGLAVDERGRLRLRPDLGALDHPEILGVGDAAVVDRRQGAEQVMSCRLAIPMGIAAADNLARQLEGRAKRPWRVIDTLRCISLGRTDGVVVFFTPRGRATRWVVTGRLAARIKEGIVRSTVHTLSFLHGRASARSVASALHHPALPPAVRS